MNESAAVFIVTCEWNLVKFYKAQVA